MLCVRGLKTDSEWAGTCRDTSCGGTQTLFAESYFQFHTQNTLCVCVCVFVCFLCVCVHVVCHLPTYKNQVHRQNCVVVSTIIVLLHAGMVL